MRPPPTVPGCSARPRFRADIEQAPAVVDARQTLAHQHPVAQHLGPQLFNFAVLGEKAMAADIEAKALVLNGPRQPANLPWILLKHRHRYSRPAELPGGGKTGRT